MKAQITSAVSAIALLLVMGTTNCTKSKLMEQDDLSGQTLKVTFNNTDSNCVDIIAGQNINVGSLCLDDMDTDSDGLDDVLTVTVTTTGCWKIQGVATWIGCGSCTPPVNKAGNPKIGSFPYQSGALDAQTYSFSIPFSDLNPEFSCPDNTENYRGAIHLNVIDTCSSSTQTAWAAGERIASKGNWGKFFGFNITCDEVTPPSPDNCAEFAWGRDPASNKCFTEVTCMSSDSWGWRNGLYTGNNQDTIDLWAGAGTCNTAFGESVGSIILSRSGSTLNITYTTSSDHPLMRVHFYAGSTEVAQSGNCTGEDPDDPCYSNCNTLAPSELGYDSGSMYSTTHTFSVTVSGDYYVVAHAEVGGFACPLR